MKVTSLIVGILLMIVSAIVGVVCLLLPSMTHNRVNFGESMVGLVPAVLFGFIGFLATGFAAIAFFRSKQAKVGGTGQ